MNFIQCEFPSDTLHTYVQLTVLLPKTMATPLMQPRQKDCYPVLYLLHGALESGNNWVYRTDLAQLVDQKEMAVVLPFVGNSFYLDEPEGLPYFTYLTEELPEYLGRTFPLSHSREETFIGGLSMGGYGSLYAALRMPWQYGKVFSLSGAMDIRTTASFVSNCGAPLPSQLRCRKALHGGPYDIFPLVEQAELQAMPSLFLACGTEDALIRDNRLMVQALENRGIPFTYQEGPGGHDWGFWRSWLTRAVSFLIP